MTERNSLGQFVSMRENPALSPTDWKIDWSGVRCDPPTLAELMAEGARLALQERRKRVLDAAVRNIAIQFGPYIIPVNNVRATLRTIRDAGDLSATAVRFIRAEFQRLWKA